MSIGIVLIVVSILCLIGSFVIASLSLPLNVIGLASGILGLVLLSRAKKKSDGA